VGFVAKKLIRALFTAKLNTRDATKGNVPVRSIFLAFEAIYVISLVSRMDRREEIRQELADFGIEIGRGAVQYIDAVKPADDGGFPSRGAHGCFLSHLEVLRLARKSGLRRFLVLEDDAMVARNFGTTDALVDFCYTDEWDFLYLGHVLPPVSGPLRWIRTVGGVQCTHAYALRGEVLPSLIHFLEGLICRPPGDSGFGPMHIDAAYSIFMDRNPGIRVFRASKNLVLQRSSKSDVAPVGISDQILPASMLGVARKLKSWVRARI
jgi:hypothetical protein